MKSIADIKAKVTFNWNHHNCKFSPGDRVVVNQGGNAYYNSENIRKRVGTHGNVLAVTVGSDGNIRTKTKYNESRTRIIQTERMYTRYYVQFNDGEIIGIHSQHLNKELPKSDLEPGQQGWYDCYQAIANS